MNNSISFILLYWMFMILKLLGFRPYCRQLKSYLGGKWVEICFLLKKLPKLRNNRITETILLSAFVSIHTTVYIHWKLSVVFVELKNGFSFVLNVKQLTVCKIGREINWKKFVVLEKLIKILKRINKEEKFKNYINKKQN